MSEPLENRCICPDPLDGRQVADCMIHGWSKRRFMGGEPFSETPPEQPWETTLAPDEVEG